MTPQSEQLAIEQLVPRLFQLAHVPLVTPALIAVGFLHELAERSPYHGLGRVLRDAQNFMRRRRLDAAVGDDHRLVLVAGWQPGRVELRIRGRDAALLGEPVTAVSLVDTLEGP